LRFSYNWLRELTEGLDVPAPELGRLITMKTAECEAVEPFGTHLADVCAAKVISAEPAGEGHNRKVVVDTGRYGVKTVVCGAPNCRPGIVTAYVPAGTRLGNVEIGTVTISGVVSEGMLASGAELGINRDAEGILELAAKPGDSLPGCAPDTVFEIDNKSITNRPDLWGHHGLARELAAITGARLREPAKLALIPQGPGAIGVDIRDFERCPRYCALAFENVKVQPSPLWLQCRLEAIGLNPISNIVDVTNFIMAEMAQPMHAFDRDTLKGPAIIVRTATEGEHFLALNDQEYHLTSSDLVIADARGAIALAGVIGGQDTSINERTTRIILESATFQATSIRKTSARLKLRTDASIRYEKAQDPVNTMRGLARAVELLREVCPGIQVVGGVAEQYRQPAPPAPIRLPMDWLICKIGRDVEPAQVRSILESLEFGVEEEAPRVFSVSVPTWRATKDVSIKDDLVEEVGRMIGYDSITPQPPMLPDVPPPRNEERLFHRSVRYSMAAQGFSEVYNYSFISEEQARALGMNPEDHVRVANPISSEQTLMRRSLLPEIRKNIVENSKQFESFRLFEIGYEIHPEPAGLPKEIPHLAAVVFAKDDGRAGLMELKRVAQHLMAGCEVQPCSALSYEHPARAAEVVWQGKVLGRLFEFHPSVVTSRAAVLDIDLDVMRSLSGGIKRYTPIRRFPSSAFDLSVLAGLRELAGDIQKRLAEFAGESLEEIEFVREYSGPPLPEGKKSVSFRLTVAAQDRTLSSEDVAAIRNRIIDSMRGLGYDLRV